MRCEIPTCGGPATVEVVALWVSGDDGRPDTVTAVGLACDFDAEEVLRAARMDRFLHGVRGFPVAPDGVRREPLGIYARDLLEVAVAVPVPVPCGAVMLSTLVKVAYRREREQAAAERRYRECVSEDRERELYRLMWDARRAADAAWVALEAVAGGHEA